MPRRKRPSQSSSLSSPHLSQTIDSPSSTSNGTATEIALEGGDLPNTTADGTSSASAGQVAPRRPRTRRTSSAPTTPVLPSEGLPAHQDDEAELQRKAEASAPEDQSSIQHGAVAEKQNHLLPPQYGRPARPSSPDVFNALFHPVFRSLSRPSSPAPRRTLESSPNLLQDSSLSETQRATSSLPSHFPPRNPTDPAPTVESQGFLLYISSLLLYVLYLFWSFLPDRYLEKAGIEWYPSREWALLIPSWITMTILYIYLGYIFLNMSNTVSLEETLASLNDPKAFVRPPLAPSSLLESSNLTTSEDTDTPSISRLYLDSILLPPEAIPPLYDLPLDVVNRVLYD
ncbi:hypothetical protein JCM5350_007018 [Sporobolomyces pararoseus]